MTRSKARRKKKVTVFEEAASRYKSGNKEAIKEIAKVLRKLQK